MKHLGWHFLPDDRRLRWNHKGKPLGPGSVRTTSAAPILCEQGLHWSANIRDALIYAPGSYVCRVEAWGNTVIGDDKGSSQTRRILWSFDAEMVLWAFLCDVAEEALNVANVTDERSWAAISLRRDWLAGKDVSPDQWDAANAAAWDAAWDASWDASSAAASAAARVAANAAAWVAANAAAWDASSAAARDAQNTLLESMIWAEARRLNIADGKEQGE